MTTQRTFLLMAALFALTICIIPQPASAALPDDCFTACSCSSSCNLACVEFIGGPTVVCEDFVCEDSPSCNDPGPDPEPEPSESCSCDTYISGGSGNDTLSGNSNNNCMYGYAGDDTLYGMAGNDMLYGGIGHDSLFGGSGNDCVYGGIGNDYLDGGSGTDLLDGQIGIDTCVSGETNYSCEG